MPRPDADALDSVDSDAAGASAAPAAEPRRAEPVPGAGTLGEAETLGEAGLGAAARARAPLPERVSRQQALEGDASFDEVVGALPPEQTVKGFLFRRLVSGLDGGVEPFREALLAPPDGEYLAFGDYPERDYGRVVFETMRASYPQTAGSEAARRVARDDFAAFASTTLGRVMIALGGDPRRALHALPGIYEKVSSHIRLRARTVGWNEVQLDFEGFRGCWAYALGQLEGIVQRYGRRSFVRTSREPGGALRFVVAFE